MKSRTVTDAYLLGVKEGRELLRMRGRCDVAEIDAIISNLNDTMRSGFPAGSVVGQTLRGELDFWKQKKKQQQKQQKKEIHEGNHCVH